MLQSSVALPLLHSREYFPAPSDLQRPFGTPGCSMKMLLFGLSGIQFVSCFLLRPQAYLGKTTTGLKSPYHLRSSLSHPQPMKPMGGRVIKNAATVALSAGRIVVNRAHVK